MPSRILREGILTSERIARLGWADEVFYRRLMSVVDDFGRYYAHPALLRAALYPLQLDKVSDSDIGKWLTACVNAALVRVYPASDGKRYLELLDFRQQVRAKDSKYPAFAEHLLDTCAADAQHVLRKCAADAPVFVSGDGVEDVVGKRPRKRDPDPDCPEDVAQEVWSDWLSLRRSKKAAVSATVLSEARKEAGKAGMPLEAFLRIWCLRGSQGLSADWIKPSERATWSQQREATIAGLTGSNKPDVFDVDARRVG
jgi:hypothetical protein